MSTTSLTRVPDQSEWATMMLMARTLAASGVVPRHAQKPEAAIAIILQGRELGIGPMQALRTIFLIEGKVTLSADLMAALIYRAHGDNALRIKERSAEACSIEYRRREWPEAATLNWTIKMGRDAGLVNKDNWKKYPEAMLFARCISAIAHTAFQDVIMGLYTPEEIEDLAEPAPVAAATTSGEATVVAPIDPARYEHDQLVQVARTEMTAAAKVSPTLWSPKGTRGFIERAFGRQVANMADLSDEELSTLIAIWRGERHFVHETGEEIPDHVGGGDSLDPIIVEPAFSDELEGVNEGAEDRAVTAANW